MTAHGDDGAFAASVLAEIDQRFADAGRRFDMMVNSARKLHDEGMGREMAFATIVDMFCDELGLEGCDDDAVCTGQCGRVGHTVESLAAALIKLAYPPSK